MKPELEDVIAAFVDGEAVDPAQLKLALSHGEGRDLLVDVLALRGLVVQQQAASTAAIALAPRRSRRARELMTAAAIAVVTLAGGYAAGWRSAERRPAPQPVSPTADAVSASDRAPAPTHVIRLENGVDWTEHAGGH